MVREKWKSCEGDNHMQTVSLELRGNKDEMAWSPGIYYILISLLTKTILFRIVWSYLFARETKRVGTIFYFIHRQLGVRGFKSEYLIWKNKKSSNWAAIHLKSVWDAITTYLRDNKKLNSPMLEILQIILYKTY